PAAPCRRRADTPASPRVAPRAADETPGPRPSSRVLRLTGQRVRHVARLLEHGAGVLVGDRLSRILERVPRDVGDAFFRLRDRVPLLRLEQEEDITDVAWYPLEDEIGRAHV